MAMALAIRNFGKINGAGLLRSARQTPLKSYTTAAVAQRTVVAKPLALVKNVITPMSRSIVTTAPKMMSAGGNHTALWTAERVVSWALLGIMPAAFLFPSQALDAIMAVSVVLHAHWGVESSVTDYVRPAVVGNVLPKVAHAGLLLISVATLGGLFYFIYNDIGIVNTVKKLWAIKGQEKQEH